MTRLNVLIVDDDESIVKTLCMTVTSLGHRAAGASSAEQALHELARGEFDFLLTDLRMEVCPGWNWWERRGASGRVSSVWS